MPKATIYIRKENEEKWAKLKDKSEFVNDALNPVVLKPIIISKVYGTTVKTLQPEINERAKKPYPISKNLETKFKKMEKEKTLEWVKNNTIENPIVEQKEVDPTYPISKNLCEHFQKKGECLVRGCKHGRGR